MVVNTIEYYSLIPVLITLTFIEGNRIFEKTRTLVITPVTKFSVDTGVN